MFENLMLDDIRTRDDLRRVPQRIVDVLLSRFKDSLSNLDPEEVIKEAENFYDVRIAPIDLQPVPNIVEPLFDSAVRSMIRPTILFALSELQK